MFGNEDPDLVRPIAPPGRRSPLRIRGKLLE
jgi:hypothetical protein